MVTQQDSIHTVDRKIHYDIDSEVEPVRFDTNTVSNYQKDSNFDYTENKEEEEGWWAQFKNWVNKIWHQFWNWLLGDYQANGFLAFLIQSLPYLIVAGIIAFIVWLFFKLNPGARLLKSKESPEMFFTEEEEIIKTKDIKKLIQKALEKKDYRLAVRYYYLFILKKLREAHIIEYEFDKTNNDYISEINEESINHGFVKATNLYDYIWYGNFSVSEAEYSKASQTFVQLENKIPKSLD